MSKYQYPKPIEYNAKGSQSATVILLHGLGDTGQGWSFLPSELTGDFKHVKFIFPNAPTRPITINMGMRMPGWYDITSLDKIEAQEDEEGLLDSKQYIEGLVKAEVDKGIPSERIVVAGFSQGGAIALMMLRSEIKLGGVVGLSTYLPLRNKAPVVSEANNATPVLMCHGDVDPVIAINYGSMSKDLLGKAGMDVDFKVYSGMGHSACPSEFKDIEAFLTKIVPAK